MMSKPHPRLTLLAFLPGIRGLAGALPEQLAPLVPDQDAEVQQELLVPELAAQIPR